MTATCSLARAMGAVFVALLAVAPLPAAAQTNRPLFFENRCRYPIRIFFYHQHNDGGWATHGWYQIAGNNGRTQLNGGSGAPLRHIEGSNLYFYAEVTRPGIDYFWQGSTNVVFGGIEYGLMQHSPLRVDNNQMYGWVNCDNLR